MNSNQVHLSSRFGAEAVIIFILLSICVVPAIAQDSFQNSAAEEVLGSLLETVAVPSEGNPVYTTNILEAGELYIIQAPGVFSYWDGSTNGADAYYDYRDQGVDYRPLQVDGRSMYDIAKKNGDPVEYNPKHFYETSIIGSGKPLMLSIWDPGPYSDNHGSLEVNIYQGQPTTNGQTGLACKGLLLDLEEGPNSIVIAKVVDDCEHKPLQGASLEIRIFHTYDAQLKKAINGNYKDLVPKKTNELGEATIQVNGSPGDIYRVDVYASKEGMDTSDRSIHITIGGNTAPRFHQLGNRIEVNEVDEYFGEWTRIEGTDIFNAIWNGGQIKDVIEIRSINDNQVTLYRRGNGGYYYGTLNEDGTIDGTASWYQLGWTWSGTIVNEGI
jgi:hypothetical protein